MTCAFTPSRCHINLAALRRNFRRLGNPGQLMPVIKADAYGHGLLPCAQALAEAGARNFAVGLVCEGELLRKNGLDQTIMPLLGCLSPEDWHVSFKNRLTPLIGSFEDLQKAVVAAKSHPGKLNVGIKCNTGMSRLGFNIDELPTLADELGRHPNLAPTILVSHLACADMPEEEDFTLSQIKNFNAFYEGLKSRYPDIARSLGNSAASLARPETHYEICRPGLALYGGDPFPAQSRTSKGKTLEWVMSLGSPITHIRNLEPGDSISYGRIFRADRRMRVAVVGAGYATGINRSLSNKIDFIINGQKARQVGRICMGMLMVDITHIKSVAPGDEAWLLGSPNPGDEPANTADDLARILDTIPYEILCAVGSLNPRIYTDD